MRNFLFFSGDSFVLIFVALTVVTFELFFSIPFNGFSSVIFLVVSRI